MKTIIDLCKISDLNCGLGQVALHLHQNFNELLSHTNNNDEIISYCEEKGSEHLKGEKLLYKKSHRYPFFFRPDCTVWHAIHQDIKVYPSPKRIKKILTIHDLNAIHEEKREDKKAKYLKNLQKKINQSHTVTFISKFTQSEVQKHLDLSKVQQKVIMNGVALNHDLESERPKAIPEDLREFFFSIGTVVPKKNFKLILDIAKALPEEKFVIAGTTFHDYAKEMSEEIKRENLGSRVFLIGEIEEAEKLYLYDNAKALIHPSFLEGFGLPIVEAYSRGLPVISSHAGSLPEVCGDYGLLFDPNSKEEAIERVKEFLEYPTTIELKNDLVNFASQFSWKKAAQEYLSLYQSLN